MTERASAITGILRRLFENLPAKGHEKQQALEQIRVEFYREFSRQFQAVIDELIQTHPQTTLNDFSELATTIGATLKLAGLATRCPRTGLPAIVVADSVQAGGKQIPRFRFRTTGTTGRARCSHTCYHLDSLDLMQAAQRVENFSKGYKDRTSGHGR